MIKSDYLVKINTEVDNDSLTNYNLQDHSFRTNIMDNFSDLDYPRILNINEISHNYSSMNEFEAKNFNDDFFLNEDSDITKSKIYSSKISLIRHLSNKMIKNFPQLFKKFVVDIYANNKVSSLKFFQNSQLWDKIKILFFHMVINKSERPKSKSNMNLCNLCGNLLLSYPPNDIMNKMDLFSKGANKFFFSCHYCAMSNFMNLYFSVCLLCLAKSTVGNKGIFLEDPKFYKPALYFACPYIGIKLLCQSCYNFISSGSVNVIQFSELIKNLPPPLIFLRDFEIYYTKSIKNYLTDIHSLTLHVQSKYEGINISNIVDKIYNNNYN